MQTQTVTLRLTEAKKHSVRYDAQDPDAAVRTLYVNKAQLGSSPYPAKLTLTLDIG